jgi:hypothetical protein
VVVVPIGAVFAYYGITAAKVGATPQTSLALASGLSAVIAVVTVLVVLPVALVGVVLSQAGLTRAAIAANMDRKMKIRAALGGVWPRFWRYLWLMILEGLLAGFIPIAVAGAAIFTLTELVRFAGGGIAAGAAVGFLSFLILVTAVVFVIWVFLGIAMALAACVAEERSAWASIKRAMKLSKGTRGRIFVMFLLVYALALVVSIAGYIPMVIVSIIVAAMGKGAQYGVFALVAAEILNLLVNFVLQTLVTPVYLIALVLFYYDQRVRTEGYDIELMMEQAGLTAPPENQEVQSEPASAGTAIESPLTPSFEPGPGPDTVKEQ